MLIRAVIVAAGLWLALAAPAPAAAACPPSSARPFADSGKVSVYTRKETIYSCRSAGGKSHRLGRTQQGSRTGIRAVQVAGRYVAYVSGRQAESSQGPFYPESIHLVNGTTGRKLDIGAVGCSPPPQQFRLIGSFVAFPSGAVAWICATFLDNGHGVSEVHAADGCGTELLASGGQLDNDPIGYTSLGRSTNTSDLSSEQIVYWGSASGAHAALLRRRTDCPPPSPR